MNIPNENTKKCPICPRACELSAPHCERGAEYAETGIIPQEREHGHDRRNTQRLHFEKKEQQLIMKYLHHAIAAADHGGITQEQAKEMFSVLTEEETVQLAELLKRLSDRWMEIASNKLFHHRK